MDILFHTMIYKYWYSNIISVSLSLAPRMEQIASVLPQVSQPMDGIRSTHIILTQVRPLR